jgi:hypothetical protein
LLALSFFGSRALLVALKKRLALFNATIARVTRAVDINDKTKRAPGVRRAVFMQALLSSS